MSMRSQVLVEHHGIATGKDMTTWQTLRRGVELSPELRKGIGVTVLLAVLVDPGTGPRAVRRPADHRRRHPRDGRSRRRGRRRPTSGSRSSASS